MKAFLTRLVLLGAMLGGAINAQAACRSAETESNNTESAANIDVCSGTNVTGYISSADDDWFRIEVAAAGTISISLTNAGGLDADWYLYKTTGSYVKSGATSSNPDTGTYSASAAGTYYIKVKRYSGAGNYTLNVSYPNGSGGGACTLPTGVNLGRVGSATDKSTTTSGGFVLMGGGTDVDAAMQWMINKSGGGDVAVLRSTGTNGYNDYLYGLGTVNSVQTLLVDSTGEGDNACVAQTIRNAEMLFIAGGNQQNYVDYFKGRAVGDAINYLINTKRVPVGGTSAGMAIMGQYYHPGGAAEGTATLSNPTAVAIGNNFLNISLLANVVTETHFSQRARQPRQSAFLASAIYNYGVAWQSVRGIAADEATAFALDVNGVGKVFGTNSVHFVKATNSPETLAPNTALTWNRAGQALQVIQVPGTANGTNTFDVGTWTGTGGAIHYWSVNNGSMTIN